MWVEEVGHEWVGGATGCFRQSIVAHVSSQDAQWARMRRKSHSEELAVTGAG